MKKKIVRRNVEGFLTNCALSAGIIETSVNIDEAGNIWYPMAGGRYRAHRGDFFQRRKAAEANQRIRARAEIKRLGKRIRQLMKIIDKPMYAEKSK